MCGPCQTISCKESSCLRTAIWGKLFTVGFQLQNFGETQGKLVQNHELREQIVALIPSDGFPIQGIADHPSYQALHALIQSQNTTDSEECGHIVTTLTALSDEYDLSTKIVLRALAESIEWPPYERGDGYWSEPSQNSVALVMIGWLLKPDEVEMARDILNSQLPGVSFIALGMTRNRNLPADIIMSLAKFGDPVTAAASEHGSLGAAEVRAMLEQIENGVWVSALVLGQDGWTWPDWQYAFEQVSTGCPESPAFWEVLLSELAKSNRWRWFEDFLDSIQDPLDDQDLDELLETMEGLIIALEMRPDLIPLAIASAWVPALVVAASQSDDTELMRELAASGIPTVCEAILGNENATEEIRALAAISS